MGFGGKCSINETLAKITLSPFLQMVFPTLLLSKKERRKERKGEIWMAIS